MLGSPSRESKESKSGTDAQPNPLRYGEIGGCSKTRKRAKGRAPFLSARHLSRHFGFHRKWLGRFLLSTGHAITRFLVLLRHTVCHGRTGLYLLRMPFC